MADILADNPTWEMLARQAQIEREEFRAKLIHADAIIASQRAWIQAAGHRKECKGSRICGKCGHVFWANLHVADKPEYTHDFIVGPCSCGWAELAGG